MGAKGKRAKSSVFSGRKVKTQGGLTKDKLVKNKLGRVVSKAMSARAKKAFATSTFGAWANAVKKARKELGLTGFVAIGGKSAAGKALYAKAMKQVGMKRAGATAMKRVMKAKRVSKIAK